MRLPIPILQNESQYGEVSLRKPTAGVVADTKRVSDGGDYFSAIQSFIEGVTVDVKKTDGTVITDKVAIKSIMKNIPYRSAEYIVIQAMLMLDDEDGVEGYFECPRCSTKLICERKLDETGEVIYDTRDRISELKVVYLDSNEDIEISLSEPVDIFMGEELIDKVQSFTLSIPTMRHCVSAFQKVGSKDQLRLQFAIYVEALKKINGIEIDQKWKTRHGKLLFENIKDIKKDFNGISKEVNAGGIDRMVTRICKECGKDWKAPVNTSNFFDFGLRSM